MNKYHIGIGLITSIGADGCASDPTPRIHAAAEAGADWLRLFVGLTICRPVFPYRVDHWNDTNAQHPHDPVFVEEWDEHWWTGLEIILRALKADSMRLTVSLVDECNIRQAIFGAPEKQGLFWWRKLWGCEHKSATMLDYQPELKVYDKVTSKWKVIQGEKVSGQFLPQLDRTFDLIKRIGLSCDVELANELFMPEMAYPEADDRYIFYHKLARIVERRYGIGHDNMLMSQQPNCYPYFKDVARLFSVHDIATEKAYRDAEIPPGIPPEDLIVSGDGGEGSGPIGPFNRRLMTPEDGRAIGAVAIGRGNRRIEIFDQSTNSNYHWDFAPMKAMREELDKDEPPPVPPVKVRVCESTLLLPNQYCPKTIEKEYPMGQEPTQTCAEHKPPEAQSCYEKYIKGRPINKWQIGKYISCMLGQK